MMNQSFIGTICIIIAIINLIFVFVYIPISFIETAGRIGFTGLCLSLGIAFIKGGEI